MGRFISLIDRYRSFVQSTNAMPNKFVKKDLVHEHDCNGGSDTTSEVDIYFYFVGWYVLPSLLPSLLITEEHEGLRKKETGWNRLHEDYIGVVLEIERYASEQRIGK